MSFEKPTAVMIDIDGTVADDRHRRHLIKWHEEDLVKRYHKYHMEMFNDEVIGRELIEQSIEAGHQVIFATARPERYRHMTKVWLEGAFPDCGFILEMRPDHNEMSSPQIKLATAHFLSDRYDIICVFDDREDVCQALRKAGYDTTHVTICGPAVGEPSLAPSAKTAGDRLRAMADTFDKRNAQYKDNWRQVPKLVEVLFPNGVPPWLLTDPRWHLFELKLVKLTRFANSELQHTDSIHDDGIYSAMIEHVIQEDL